MYLTQHLDDAAIAARYQEPTWQITQQRRELGIRRPPATPPRQDRGGLPDPETLRRLYAQEQHTLAQIGRTYRTAASKVRAALDAAGIPVGPRTSRASRTEYDPQLLASSTKTRSGQRRRSPPTSTAPPPPCCGPCTITTSPSGAAAQPPGALRTLTSTHG